VSNSTAFGEGKDAQVQMLTLIRSMLQSGEAQPVPGSLGTAGGGLGSTALESILSTVVPGASTVTRNARALR
jgi:hypothetical protein